MKKLVPTLTTGAVKVPQLAKITPPFTADFERMQKAILKSLPNIVDFSRYAEQLLAASTESFKRLAESMTPAFPDLIDNSQQLAEAFIKNSIAIINEVQIPSGTTDSLELAEVRAKVETIDSAKFSLTHAIAIMSILITFIFGVLNYQSDKAMEKLLKEQNELLVKIEENSSSQCQTCQENLNSQE